MRIQAENAYRKREDEPFGSELPTGGSSQIAALVADTSSPCSVRALTTSLATDLGVAWVVTKAAQCGSSHDAPVFLRMYSSQSRCASPPGWPDDGPRAARSFQRSRRAISSSNERVSVRLCSRSRARWSR